MPKPSDILGMNARNRLFTVLNSKKSREYADSKYATKALMLNKEISTAEIYGILTNSEDVRDFEWEKINPNFVIKPSNGHAGKGIIAFKKIHYEGEESTPIWIDTLDKEWSLDDIQLHCSDILEGQYSTFGRDHKILIEERVPIHPKLAEYSYKGTPDLRIIVFNNIPIMALLRLPTEQSGGRANQSQGAIGVGVDMSTGLTTNAAANLDQMITFLPGTDKKLTGIKIPFWQQCLTTAVKAASAAGLEYSGIDLFIHPEKGSMVVELNALPGLSIQIANQAGLRSRLERVRGLNVINANHGVRIGQALFAERYADDLISREGLTILRPKEAVRVLGDDNSEAEVTARINTGRYRSAISEALAEELGLVDLDDLLWFQKERSEGNVPVVEVALYLSDHKIKTAMIVSKRLNRSSFKIEIGRRDLSGFLVGVEETS